MLLAPGQQTLRFGQASLPNPQRREPRDGRCGYGGAVTRLRFKRITERLLRVVPAPRGDEHVRMDRAAHAEERHDRVPGRVVLDVLAPLCRALPIAGVGARDDQVAVGLTERARAADAAGARGGHRFLELPHPLVEQAAADLAAADETESEHLQVAVGARAA